MSQPSMIVQSSKDEDSMTSMMLSYVQWAKTMAIRHKCKIWWLIVIVIIVCCGYKLSQKQSLSTPPPVSPVSPYEGFPVSVPKQ